MVALPRLGDCSVVAPRLHCGCAWVVLRSLTERSVLIRWFLSGYWLVGCSPVDALCLSAVARLGSSSRLLRGCSVVALWLLCVLRLARDCSEVFFRWVSVEVVWRLLSSYPDIGICLLSGCCRLPPGCSQVALRLL